MRKGRSTIRWISPTRGRTPTARIRTARCGQRSLLPDTRTWVALELSSFKCGHDAPIYTVVEETVQNSGTPYFCFKDIDENRPTGSIRIRVETIDYFLRRYREDLVRKLDTRSQVEEQLADFERELRQDYESGVMESVGVSNAEPELVA